MDVSEDRLSPTRKMRGTVELDQYVGIDNSVAYFQALDSSVCYKQRRKDIALVLHQLRPSPLQRCWFSFYFWIHASHFLLIGRQSNKLISSTIPPFRFTDRSRVTPYTCVTCLPFSV